METDGSLRSISTKVVFAPFSSFGSFRKSQRDFCGLHNDPELSLGNDRGVVPQPVAGLWLKTHIRLIGYSKIPDGLSMEI